MLYTVTYKRKNIITEILNKKEVSDALKFFEANKNYYSLVSITPTTAEDIAGKVVDFLKYVTPYDYADFHDVGETDEEMVAKLAANLLDNKNIFYDDIAALFDEPEILDSSEQDYREHILKIIKEF